MRATLVVQTKSEEKDKGKSTEEYSISLEPDLAEMDRTL